MQTLVDPLKRALQIRPKEVAVIDGEKVFTYEELWDRCSRLVGALICCSSPIFHNAGIFDKVDWVSTLSR